MHGADGGWRRRLASLLVAVAALLGTSLVAAVPAQAHPVLLFTDPALDTAVTASPASVTLVFNEAVTASSRAIRVSHLRGESVSMDSSQVKKQGTVVTAKVQADLKPGTYLVRWEATGVDGHGIDGEFRFAVGTAVTGAGASTGAGGTDWMAALLRWLLLAAFAVAFGGIVAERFTTSARAENPRLPVVRPWAGWAATGGLIAAIAASAVLVADLDTVSVLWDSGPGIALAAEVAGFGLSLVLLATRRRAWALLPLAAVGVAEGAVSHSNVELPVAGAALTAVHVIAAGLWLGALIHIGRAVLRWRSSRPAMRWVLTSYARMAAWVFVVVVVTGLTTALLLVPLPALTTTAYGQTLLVKLTLVLTAAALAVVGRWALRTGRLTRLSRTLPVEATTLVVVLAATAALVSTPLPGDDDGAPPPPPAKGVAVPAGGLAGQVGVNVVASKGQVVVRLSTPRPGNAYTPGESPDYRLSGSLERAGQKPVPVRFRSCGGACFVAPLRWVNGENVLSVRAGASGWRGGTFAALIPWPAREAGKLVERTVRVMRELKEFTVYEAGTSDTGAGFPEPRELPVDGETFLSNEPYNSGVAPIAAVVSSDGGRTRLLLGFPAAGAHTALTLDAEGRIVEETLTGPKHVFQRRFLYPESH